MHLKQEWSVAIWHDKKNEELSEMRETIRQTDFFLFFPLKRRERNLIK